MLKFAANLSWLFNEVPLIERFSQAAAAGFQATECLFPYQEPIDSLVSAQRNSGLPVVLINAPPGRWDQGERGLASLPKREEEFRQSLQQAREYALALGCKQIHIMAGNRNSSITEQQQYDTLVKRLSYAADYLLADNIKVLIEPLNTEDMPGYFISTFTRAIQLIKECNKENIFLQFDIYHCQKIQGNISRSLQHYWPLISHLQIASVPNRNEPDGGEINYPWLFNYLASHHYSGWIGCEYQPQTTTREGLDWFTHYKTIN
ncbi:2-oxo-tetronate isomerase [Yersinia alsatica]|uniref:2-oxo-tetronate isomerase n=1 Tax=Yersinia alsatica TaxID=2890317 RepID=UPI0011A88AD8|nr:2-oxo-tetronate isomerase [Yersinia alsatica]